MGVEKRKNCIAEVNGGATTGKWDRTKAAGQTGERNFITRDSEKVLPEANRLAQGLLNG